MNDSKWKTAGLIFLGSRNLDIVALSNRVSTQLETLNQKVNGVRIMSDQKARVASQTHQVQLSVKHDVKIRSLGQSDILLLEIAVSGNDGAAIETAGAAVISGDSVLAHTLKALQRALHADFIQWTNQDLLLRAADFAKAAYRDEATGAAPRKMFRERVPQNVEVARIGVTPARVSRVRKLPSIEETNEILQNRMTQKQILVGKTDIQCDLREIFRENLRSEDVALDNLDDDIEYVAPLRLSAWALSFGVALFALPIGAALVVLNLMKGENLRLASQTAALTGTFIALESYGATAEAMTKLANFVG